MDSNASERQDGAAPPLESSPPRWRGWLGNIVIFSAVFALLLTVLSELGKIVEQFFVTLYVN